MYTGNLKRVLFRHIKFTQIEPLTTIFIHFSLFQRWQATSDIFFTITLTCLIKTWLSAADFETSSNIILPSVMVCCGNITSNLFGSILSSTACNSSCAVFRFVKVCVPWYLDKDFATDSWASSLKVSSAPDN